MRARGVGALKPIVCGRGVGALDPIVGGREEYVPLVGGRDREGIKKLARVGDRNARSSHCGCGWRANGGGSSMAWPPTPGAWYAKTDSDGDGA